MKEFNEEMVYKSLKDVFDKIYLEYQFLNLNEDDFYNLIINEIRISIDDYGDDTYVDYLVKNIKKALNKKVKLLLDDDNNMIGVINRYCNYLTVSNEYIDNLFELKKLCIFLDNNDISVNIDLCLEILNNDKVNGIVQSVVEKNIKNIQENKGEYVFHDEIILSFIEAYCLLNDIEISGYNDEKSFNKNYYTDSLKTYLYDISQESLLSKDEEIELAYRVRKGDKNAKKEFIIHNLRLVVSIAKNYYVKDIPFLDLIQEGNIGLMLAIDKYNPNLDVRFSTYATYWIKQSISRAILSKSSPIKVSYSMYEKIKQYQKKLNKVLKSFDYTPTIYEISEKMNLTIKEIEEFEFLSRKAVSLNTLVGEEDVELGELIPNNELSVEDCLFENDLENNVQIALNKAKLTEREKMIIKCRYGLDNLKPETLLNIGKMFNITHERVRQIELSALAKIRKSEEAVRILSEYSFNPEKDYKNLECFYHKKQRKYQPYYMIKKK